MRNNHNFSSDPDYREREKGFLSISLPKNLHELACLVFGLPLEKLGRNLKTPIIIRLFITIAVLFFAHTAFIEPEFALKFGFIPANPFRHEFKTLIASFFLHAGWLHCLGNMYYFYVFGDDIEHHLGPVLFVILLFGGHLMGLVLHAAMTSNPAVPLVGASAGISALLGYYMICWPMRKVSYFIFLFVRIHLPAFLVFGWKVVTEIIYTQAPAGMSRVAFWAHTGGALFGIAFALAIKMKVFEAPREFKNY